MFNLMATVLMSVGGIILMIAGHPDASTWIVGGLLSSVIYNSKE